MGTYTEFIFGCSLSKDTPRECVEALDLFINGEDKKPKYENPTTRSENDYNNAYIERTLERKAIDDFAAKYAIRDICRSGSFWFGAPNASRFHYNIYGDDYRLSIRSNIMNYNDVIGKFIEYISPYVIDGSGTKNVIAYAHREGRALPVVYGKGWSIDLNKLLAENV